MLCQFLFSTCVTSLPLIISRIVCDEHVSVRAHEGVLCCRGCQSSPWVLTLCFPRKGPALVCLLLGYGPPMSIFLAHGILVAHYRNFCHPRVSSFHPRRVPLAGVALLFSQLSVCAVPLSVSCRCESRVCSARGIFFSFIATLFFLLRNWKAFVFSPLRVRIVTRICLGVFSVLLIAWGIWLPGF